MEFNIFKPFKYWWKCRKVFRRPHIKYGKRRSHLYFLPCYNKIFHLSFNELGYKYKYDEPRFEWNPYIHLKLFNKIEYIWSIECPIKTESKIDDMIYWESILWYNMTGDVKKAYEMNMWNKSIDNNKEYYTCLDMLKPKYKKLIENDIRNT